jgi:flagellar biosynthesis protein
MSNKGSTERASALKYSAGLPAPFIIAKGRGELAVKMQRLAEEHGIPVREDAALSEVLDVLETGDFIPEELYEIVAELYTFVLRMQDEV